MVAPGSGTVVTLTDVDIVSDLTEPGVHPSMIRWCRKDRKLTGFQVWYGEYDPIVGQQHGDISADQDFCQDSLISENQQVHNVTIYKQFFPDLIIGIKFELRNERDAVAGRQEFFMGD